MEIKQHVKGVVIALISATVLLFTISFKLEIERPSLRYSNSLKFIFLSLIIFIQARDLEHLGL